MENELIKIETKDGKQVVSARELFEKLITSQGKQERFSQWFNRHLKYGFEKGIDFMESKKIYTANQYGGEKELEDYVITIDMAKELCMLQKSEVGREFRKYFIECEKQLKEVKQKPQLSPQEQLALQLFNGGIDAITAHKQLLELETKELTNTIEEQKPFVAIAKERIVKGECVSLTDVTKGLNLKKGQISVWAKNNGLLSKVGTEVNKKGEAYFKIYIDKKGFKCVGIKEKGIDLINNNLEDIKNSPSRMTKK